MGQSRSARCSTISTVKSWDIIVIGAGVIGLSLARLLRAESLKVAVFERSGPASEATYAAGGMIAHCDPHTPDLLEPLVRASAAMYPGFVQELEAETGGSVDLRDFGTVAWLEDGSKPKCSNGSLLSQAELSRIEPLLSSPERAWFLPESSVDPRALGHGLAKSAKKRGVDFVTGSPVMEVLVADTRASGVRTSHASYSAGTVVNCAGAWAAQISPGAVPSRPVKGQMLCLVPRSDDRQAGPMIRHVVRAPDIYIIPRSDGRILLGATVEEAGFDKRVDTETIQRLYHAGLDIVPALASMRIHDAWAGLRPAAPDNLPVLGETSLRGYYAATGHYRDGIMLAPVTALLMAQILSGREPDADLKAFSPRRFDPP